MTLERTQEILDFYGTDTMLLIGGNLLLAGERITEETERFARAVAELQGFGRSGEGPTGPIRMQAKPTWDQSRSRAARKMDIEQPPNFRPVKDDFRWEAVAHQPYKQDGSAPFKDISRQVLFHEDALACELRYFEMDAGGYSTLERHEHAHAVMILRGEGDAWLVQRCGRSKQFDLVSIPAWQWHQFRATPA